MKPSKLFELLATLFITLPIWFYLLYWILSQLNPDRLIWFLYWTYVPLIILIAIISKAVEEND